MRIEPGIYRNLDMADYHNGFGISKSGLDALDEAPIIYHERYHLGLVKKETPAMRRGKAFHALRDGTFPLIYAIGPEVKSRSEKPWKEFVAANPDKICLKPSEADTLTGMSAAIGEHDEISEIMGRPGEREVSFYWLDYLTGVLCKCRPDFITSDFDVVVDDKTTDDPSPEGFQWTAFNHNYHVSAAMTLEGIEAVTGIRPRKYIYLAVSPSRPFLVGAYEATEEEILLGQEFIRKNLAKFRQCLSTNTWPGLSKKILPLGLPRKAKFDVASIVKEHAALDELIS
jgi:exodeoxyribonuclease VIII